MTTDSLLAAYDFSGRTAVVTGGTGVLGRAITGALSVRGANVALISRDTDKAGRLIRELGLKNVFPYAADVLDAAALRKAAGEILSRFGQVDMLVNGAGGNQPGATTNPQQSFFQLPEEALGGVANLNFLGTVLPSQIFGHAMAERKDGVILNVTSMSAFRPLTRVAGYSAAKAAVSNFTMWLAVHMAQEYSPRIRVNAIAPGFFLTDQNRFLLTDQKTGELTPRGKKILEHTPMGRFGEPDDLIGTVLWLLSPMSTFVTGIIVPVDGGFSACAGV